MKILTTLMAAIALFLVGTVVYNMTAQAQTLDVIYGINGTTSHNFDCGDCNESQNNLLGVAYTGSNGIGGSVSRYHNSDWKISETWAVHYRGAYDLPLRLVFEATPMFGVVSGYEKVTEIITCWSNLCPYVALDMTLMVADRVGITHIRFGPYVGAWAIKARFAL